MIRNNRNKSFEELEYADFGVRLGAYIIDFLGMMVGYVPFGLVVGYLLGGETVLALPEIVWDYFSYVIYNTFVLAIWSTTLGKSLFGLSVRTVDNKPLTFVLALKRSLLQPLSIFLILVGYWTGAGYGNVVNYPMNQTWHDMSVGTVVTQRKTSLVLAYLVTCIVAFAFVLVYVSFFPEQ